MFALALCGARQMLSDRVVVVRTADVPTTAMGDQMATMRHWLDRQGVNLAHFQAVSLGAGKVAFDAHFRDVEQAELFHAAFGISDQSR
jgi:hypothetical protein